MTRSIGVVSMMALAATLAGCDGDGGEDAGTDSGPPVDAGEFSACPTSMVPAPEELMGACCWRSSNEDQLDMAELRITYLNITAPEASPLSTMTVGRVLNESLQEERFNWLFRVESMGDGPVTITTGYGRRNDADGTYEFSQGMGSGDPAEWCPIQLMGDIAGEEVNTTPVDGAITVPVFDETGMNLQIELQLLNISIENSTFSENRTCIGSKSARPYTYEPAATLVGYVDVATARTQDLMVGTINASVCAVLAGSIDDPMYCDMDQSMWISQPDSFCDASGCTRNTPGMTDVCDPANGDPMSGGCNAWQFVAEFAAAGVDITNGLCM